MSVPKLYRYHNTGNSVFLESYPVLRTTPKGVWITFFGKEKWVSLETKKRFAYETKELAWRSFLLRKNRQVSHLKRKLAEITSILSESQALNNRIPENGDTYDGVSSVFRSTVFPDLSATVFSSEGHFYDYDDPPSFNLFT